MIDEFISPFNKLDKWCKERNLTWNDDRIEENGEVLRVIFFYDVYDINFPLYQEKAVFKIKMFDYGSAHYECYVGGDWFFEELNTVYEKWLKEEEEKKKMRETKKEEEEESIVSITTFEGKPLSDFLKRHGLVKHVTANAVCNCYQYTYAFYDNIPTFCNNTPLISCSSDETEEEEEIFAKYAPAFQVNFLIGENDNVNEVVGSYWFMEAVKEGWNEYLNNKRKKEINEAVVQEMNKN